MNIPNFFTLSRIFLVPIFVIFFYLPMPWSRVVAALVFAFAAITDWLDGFLARQLKQTSQLGRFLDPVADKLLVAISLVLIVGEGVLPYLAIPAAIIIAREVIVSALREWMAEIGKSQSVAVSVIGKIKTISQMVAIMLLILQNEFDTSVFSVGGMILLYLSAVLTLWSMIMYLLAAWPTMFTMPDEPKE